MVASVLTKIVEHKKTEVATRKKAVPLERFQVELLPSKRSLAEVLAQEGNRFILEYKRSSPSKGEIRPGFTPAECVAAYHSSADAYSVLTDEHYFGGHHNLLKQVSQLDSKPTLCKDFFVDPYQIYEARFYGADAILLMLSVLSDAEYEALARVAETLNLDVLTEVHTEEECTRAINLGASIIGINNRDLRDLSIDLSVTEKLASRIPNDRIIISESGITTRTDVTRLAPEVDGFLVGSSLMQSKDVGQAAKRLVYGSIKICGVKSKEIALSCVESGADYIGLMRYPKSTRFVDAEIAQKIIEEVSANYVGVFVDESIETILNDVETLGLSVVQLHGTENTQYVRELQNRLATDVEVWKVVHVDSDASIDAVKEALQLVNRVVLDYRLGEQLGGTGTTFDWSLLDKIMTTVNPSRVVIAGGINRNNVQELFSHTSSTVDLSSGVEVEKGEKDISLIEKFFDQCRFNGIKQSA